MSNTFDDCLLFVLKHEGGYSNDPNDAGGETKYGIAKASHPGVDILNLTQAQASDIYRAEYWEPTHCYSLAPSLALCVFDMAVNMGCKTAVEILQKAAGANPDGEFGPATLKAVQASSIKLLVAAMHMLREAHYRALSSFDRFGKGWLARNDACRDLAMSWVA